MSPSEAPATTNPYRLSAAQGLESASVLTALKRLAPVLADQRRSVVTAFAATIVSSVMGLLGPGIIGRTVDSYIRHRDFRGVPQSAGGLFAPYLTGPVAADGQAQPI